MVARRWTAAQLAVLMLAVGACSGSSEGNDSANTKAASGRGGNTARPNTAAGLRDAEEALATASLASDATSSYRLLSAECTKKYSPSQWADRLTRAGALIKGAKVKHNKDLKVASVETWDVTRTSGEARAFIVTKKGTLVDDDPFWDKWLYQNSGWRFTDCEQVGSSPSFTKVPRDAPMKDVLAERIDEFRPAGVEFQGATEERANEIQQFNSQAWDFIAPDEPTLVAAAQAERDAAIADGWTLDRDFQGENNGLFSAALSKGAMELRLVYTTAAYFVQDPYDEEELGLSVELRYDPSMESDVR